MHSALHVQVCIRHVWSLVELSNALGVACNRYVIYMIWHAFHISNTSTIACNIYFFSEKLPQNLQKVIHECTEVYLTLGTTPDISEQDGNIHTSSEARRKHLLEWIGPWNRGVGKTFPMCTLASMLCETSNFAPADIALDDVKASLFGSWRTVCLGPNSDLFKKFILPDMKTHMRKASKELEFQPLWLIMSICFNAGLYNPQMGYAVNASFWHQIPPAMEAFIMHEVSCIVDQSRILKLGLVVDKRPGYYNIHVFIHVLFIL
jgi:hypothetical protein